MTCIVGVVDDGRVYLGGDAAATGSAFDSATVTAPKVFEHNWYVIGYTSSFRMGQLIEHALSVPKPPKKADLHAFMCVTFVDTLRDCLKEGGWATRDKEQEEGGQILVGVAGRLFTIQDDYAVLEFSHGYQAVGAGSDLALGALSALEQANGHMDPATRLGVALSAAAEHNASVRPPFTVVAT